MDFARAQAEIDTIESNMVAKDLEDAACFEHVVVVRHIAPPPVSRIQLSTDFGSAVIARLVRAIQQPAMDHPDEPGGDVAEVSGIFRA
ncbi:hypothetical protein D3C87_1892400 [compost metagenome]